MWVCLGLLALAIVFVVFGSKEEEASILYYDMEDEAVATDAEEIEDAPAEAPPSKRRAKKAEAPVADAPAESKEEAADIAASIYNDITL